MAFKINYNNFSQNSVVRIKEMNKFEQIRNQIMQGKKRSIFNLKPIDEALDFLPTFKNQRNATIDSESNFSLFPLINISDEGSNKKLQEHIDSGEVWLSEKVQLRPFLREKRNKKAQTCESTRKSSRARHDSIENVSSLMARPYVPSIRINKAFEKPNRQFSRTERLSSLQNVVTFVKRESKAKKTSPKKSPKKFRRSNRVRRTISPKKQLSPTRKFSISAWQIPGEEADF